MTGALPGHDLVRDTMAEILAHAAATSTHPTITAVERRLGITHPTFYRNYPDLITWFKQQRADKAPAPPASAQRGQDEAGARLRRENRELRAQVALYAETIRQLTLDNQDLQAQVASQANLVDLDSRRARRTTR